MNPIRDQPPHEMAVASAPRFESAVFPWRGNADRSYRKVAASIDFLLRDQVVVALPIFPLIVYEFLHINKELLPQSAAFLEIACVAN